LKIISSVQCENCSFLSYYRRHSALMGARAFKTMEIEMVWSQVYDPLGNIWLSALMAAIPVVVMLGCIAFGHMKAHYAAGLGLASALAVSIFGFGMPAGLAWNAAGFGAAFGLLPIGWIVLNIIFLHQLTIENGSFSVLQDSLTGITDDRRIQLLLIAFCFGAFFEGAAGFGTRLLSQQRS
jgi:lactate permease